MIGNFVGNIEYFNPRQIGGLRLWLDAVDPAGNGTQPVNASAVSSWVDKSGFGNTVAQGTGANQPTYRTNILNGKPVVRFDGSNDLMQKTSATLLSTENSFFVAGTINANGTNRGTFFDYSTTVATNTGANFFVESGGGIKWNVNFFDGTIDNAASAIITLPQTAVCYVYNEAGTGYIYVNGVQVASVATGNMSTSGTRAYTLGALFGAVASYFLNGDIGEILFFNSPNTAAQRLLLNRYLGNKWGIAQP